MDALVTLKLIESFYLLCCLKFAHNRIDQRRFVEFSARCKFAIENDCIQTNLKIFFPLLNPRLSLRYLQIGLIILLYGLVVLLYRLVVLFVWFGCPFLWFGRSFLWFGRPFVWFGTPFVWYGRPFFRCCFQNVTSSYLRMIYLRYLKNLHIVSLTDEFIDRLLLMFRSSIISAVLMWLNLKNP